MKQKMGKQQKKINKVMAGSLENNKIEKPPARLTQIKIK